MKKTTELSKRIRDLRIVLFAEVFTVPAVIIIFKLIEPKSHAGIVAGSMFVIVGLFLVFKNYQWVNYKKSPVFWLACVHVFFVAIPMLTIRSLNWGIPFEELVVFGLPGPVLHKISEKVFMALLFMTFIELFMTRSLYTKSNNAGQGKEHTENLL